ncbi:MAG: carboxypeptidase-like regulatory domain-containing protein, partial [Vicinamibacterales bacterium]
EVIVPDFAMAPGRVGSISGTAMSSSGMPLAGASVGLSQEFTGPGSSSSFGAAGAKVGPDGSFTIRNVTPGEYKLTVTTAAAGGPMEGVSTPLVYAGDDLGGVMLVTSPAGAMRGHVVSDTGEPLPAGAAMRVLARPVDPRSTWRPSGSLGAENGRVQEDGTFEVAGVLGPTRLSVLALPHGWGLKSIVYDGRDLADVPLDVQGGRTINGITVVLSKSMPTVQGTLLDATGLPAAGTVLLYPDDPARWSEEARLTRAARPDETGTFQFEHTVPGSYLVAALEYVRPDQWADPEFLDGLRARATRVSVSEGTPPAAVALTLKRE